MRGSDSIMWTVKFRNGKIKRFKFPIRTTPEGGLDPYTGIADVNVNAESLKGERLCDEIGIELTAPKK